MAKIRSRKDKNTITATNGEGEVSINLDSGEVTELPPTLAEDAVASFWTYNGIDDFVPTKEQKNDIWDYCFCEHGHCYFKANFNSEAREVRLRQISNFTMNILYHILRGRAAIRVIELKNDRNKTAVVNVETKQLTGFQGFKEFTEGQGNFRFFGTAVDLQLIKAKLFEAERPCVQVETLGWHKKGFYTFANGIFTNTFVEADKYGIVRQSDTNYFIPYGANDDDYQFINEKKFSWRSGHVTFANWAEKYNSAFGDVGMVSIVFACATLFSDSIFRLKNNFPILFLYGEGGSGKSTVVNFIQHLFGEPQPPLKLSEKANTDKAKIRKLAQFANAIGCMEEFVNSLDMSVIKTITGVYDRFGYERSTIDTKYGTETVPVSSCVIITGNEYPQDDPLLQRLIMMDYNNNQRSEEVVKAFDELRQMNNEGITCVTGQILLHRDTVVAKFKDEYRAKFNDFKTLCEGIGCPDRMLENNAVLLATHSILRHYLDFPFTEEMLSLFLRDTLKKQTEKRDTGGVLQRFWDLVLHLANKGIIRHGKEFQLDGDEIMIRYKEIYQYYNEAHIQQYRQSGLSSATLLQKLKDSNQYMKYENCRRFPVGMDEDGDKRSSCHVFAYHTLGIDLLHVIKYQRDRSDDYRRAHNVAAPEPVGNEVFDTKPNYGI